MQIISEQLETDIKSLSEKDLKHLRKFVISLLEKKEREDKKVTAEESKKDLAEK